MSVIVRFRVLSLRRVLWLLLGCALAISGSASGQMRIAAIPKPQSGAHAGGHRSAHPEDLIQSTLALYLCVDGSAVYPCPDPITSDDTYIPAISLTYGQVLDGVVVYGAVDAASPTSGTITIYQETPSATVAVCILVIGVNRECPPNSTIFDAGNYTLTATLTFPAGSIYAPSTAAPVAISVAQDPTSIDLTSSANPAALGTAVTFTALVKGTYPAIPTGQAVFTVDGTTAPAVALDPTGAATLTTSALGLGLHSITAAYAGATDFQPAEDTTLKQQIVPPATMTTIASSVNPSTVGESVTFTSTVTTAAGSDVTPTAAVTFKDGTSTFATVPLVPKGGQNVAQTSISSLASGTHNITAIYAGDAATSASVSPVLVQQVNYALKEAPPGYTITVKPAAVSLVAGSDATLTVTVTPVSGFSGAVALSCGNLPHEAACTFGEATVPAGGGSTTLELTTMFPHDCGSDVPYGGFAAALRGPGAGTAAPRALRYADAALAGWLLLVLPRRRRGWIRCLMALTILSGIAGMNGCGSRCTDFGTTPGSYTFKVNGTAPSDTPVTAGGTPSGETSDPNVSVSVALMVKS